MKQITTLNVAVLVASFSSGAWASTYTTHVEYDIANARQTLTDPNGHHIELSLNALNQLSTMRLLDAPGIPTYSYSYDTTNQLSGISSPDNQQTYTYDAFDRLETIKDLGQATPWVTFKYDHRDRITWINYREGGGVCYEYDGDSRITRIGRMYTVSASAVCSAANEKTDVGYDTKGRLSSTRYPNGITGFRTYDDVTGQLKTAGYRRANGTLVYSDTYEYWPGSSLYYSITRSTPSDVKTTLYTYDAYERLLTVTEADGRYTEFAYDAFGNRTSENITNIKNPTATQGGPKANGLYTYEYTPNSNRLERVKLNGQVLESYLYDNAGRITQRAHAKDGITTYTFDDRGLLTQVTKPTQTITYTYDALGVRKSKTVNGQTTRYLTATIGGLPHVLAETDVTGAAKRVYMYVGSQQIKQEGAPGDRSADAYLLHDNNVGSLTHVIGMQGNITAQFDYDAFGVPTVKQGNANAYGYTGEEYDGEAGLLYLRARYYDPKLGRFISADSYLGRLQEPGTQNRYVYVQGNPVSMVDPSGFDGHNNAVFTLSFGFNATFFFSPLFIPAGGVSAGINVTFATSGQVALQANYALLVGAGGYVGAEGQAAVGRSNGPLETTLIPEPYYVAEAGMGAGETRGIQFQTSMSSDQVGTGFKGGAGAGFYVAGG
ncbi:MAG: RHS repeat-associated core domain-containing protein [Pseudomonadota bacterium]